jgi:hypothetical protein
MAAYGDDSSRSALTFMPPVTRQMVSRPLESPVLACEPLLVCIYFYGGCRTHERSVTWTKVSLNEAKMRATPKTSSPVERLGLGLMRSLCSIAYLRALEGRGKCSPERSAQPSSWEASLRCRCSLTTARLRGCWLNRNLEAVVGKIICAGEKFALDRFW